MKINNKLIALSTTALFAVFSFNNPLKASALITPTFSYDYSYTFNTGTPWLIKDSTGTPDNFIPTATRYLDSGLYTYTLDMTREYTGGGSTVVGITQWPLDTLIQFTRSNSTWFDWSGSGDFAPTASAISTTTTSIISKLIMVLTNTSDNAYSFYIDNDTNTGNRSFNLYYNGVNLFPAYINFSNSAIQQVYIPPNTTVRIEMVPTSSSSYLDALYIKDLGMPNADVINDATADGYNDGYSDGYDTGLDDGYNDGYNDGFVDGDSGTTGIGPLVNLLSKSFQVVNEVMSIEILGPFITIGTIALFPLLGAVLLFFKKVIQ